MAEPPMIKSKESNVLEAGDAELEVSSTSKHPADEEGIIGTFPQDKWTVVAGEVLEELFRKASSAANKNNPLVLMRSKSVNKNTPHHDVQREHLLATTAEVVDDLFRMAHAAVASADFDCFSSFDSGVGLFTTNKPAICRREPILEANDALESWQETSKAMLPKLKEGSKFHGKDAPASIAAIEIHSTDGDRNSNVVFTDLGLDLEIIDKEQAIINQKDQDFSIVHSDIESHALQERLINQQILSGLDDANDDATHKLDQFTASKTSELAFLKEADYSLDLYCEGPPCKMAKLDEEAVHQIHLTFIQNSNESETAEGQIGAQSSHNTISTKEENHTHYSEDIILENCSRNMFRHQVVLHPTSNDNLVSRNASTVCTSHSSRLADEVQSLSTLEHPLCGGDCIGNDNIMKETSSSIIEMVADEANMKQHFNILDKDEQQDKQISSRVKIHNAKAEDCKDKSADIDTSREDGAAGMTVTPMDEMVVDDAVLKQYFNILNDAELQDKPSSSGVKIHTSVAQDELPPSLVEDILFLEHSDKNTATVVQDEKAEQDKQPSLALEATILISADEYDLPSSFVDDMFSRVCSGNSENPAHVVRLPKEQMSQQDALNPDCGIDVVKKEEHYQDEDSFVLREQSNYRDDHNDAADMESSEENKKMGIDEQEEQRLQGDCQLGVHDEQQEEKDVKDEDGTVLIAQSVNEDEDSLNDAAGMETSRASKMRVQEQEQEQKKSEGDCQIDDDKSHFKVDEVSVAHRDQMVPSLQVEDVRGIHGDHTHGMCADDDESCKVKRRKIDASGLPKESSHSRERKVSKMTCEEAEVPSTEVTVSTPEGSSSVSGNQLVPQLFQWRHAITLQSQQPMISTLPSTMLATASERRPQSLPPCARRRHVGLSRRQRVDHLHCRPTCQEKQTDPTRKHEE